MTRRNGFVLLEILVALAILAMTLGLAFQSLSGSFGWLDRGSRETRALLVGQSLLDAASVDPAPATGRSPDGLAWRVDAIRDGSTVTLTVTLDAGSRPVVLPGLVP